MAILWFFYTIVAAIILKEPRKTICPSASDATVAILSSVSTVLPSDDKNGETACDFHEFVDLSSNIQQEQEVDRSFYTSYSGDSDLIQLSDDEDDGHTILSKHDLKNDLGKVFIEPQNKTKSSLPKFSSAKVCLLITFLTLFITEIVQTSISMIAYSRFGWGIDQISTLSFFNLILIVPMSIIIGWLSTSLNDRKIALILLPISMIGLLLLIDFTDFGERDTTTIYNYYSPPADDEYNWFTVNPTRYSIGSIIVFTSLSACSSISASSLSKVLSPEFAKSTYNAAFFTTLVGSVSIDMNILD